MFTLNDWIIVRLDSKTLLAMEKRAKKKLKPHGCKKSLYCSLVTSTHFKWQFIISDFRLCHHQILSHMRLRWVNSTVNNSKRLFWYSMTFPSVRNDFEITNFFHWFVIHIFWFEIYQENTKLILHLNIRFIRCLVNFINTYRLMFFFHFNQKRQKRNPFSLKTPNEWLRIIFVKFDDQKKTNYLNYFSTTFYKKKMRLSRSRCVNFKKRNRISPTLF